MLTAPIICTYILLQKLKLKIKIDLMQDVQGETADKKSEVEYEAPRYPVRPEKTRCRCFCPSELSRVTIYLPCPNFKECRLVFCPFQHMKKDFLDDQVAKRGKGVDDLVMVRLRSASRLHLTCSFHNVHMY